MIAGCYTLDLYCDDNDEDGMHAYGEFPKQYTSEHGTKARRAARRNGWVINMVNGTAICPKHSRKKARP